jgi:hypothetical protein
MAYWQALLIRGGWPTDDEEVRFAVNWGLSCLVIAPLAMLLLTFGSWPGVVVIGMVITALGVAMVVDYRGLTTAMRESYRRLGLKVSPSTYRVLPWGVLAMGLFWIVLGLFQAF